MNIKFLQEDFRQPVALKPIEACKIGVIGLGYVGLPLAAALGGVFETVGFDINETRIQELANGQDSTQELTPKEIGSIPKLLFSSTESDLARCDVLVVAVPTPVNASRTPDLRPLISASEVVGRTIRKGGVVIYESTVYPGATEEVCIPIIESISGLRYNVDFFAGYSPERINPGDKDRPINKIVKVTSGSNLEVADFVDALYLKIIEVGTFKASSIKVAEASKIIENTQRDVNIALINELSMILSHLDIDTHEVLGAAATKWNFIRMNPGLVGGHCIGVDPYYLLHRSIAAGYIPDIIRTAREINDGMALNSVNRLIKAMVHRGLQIKEARVLVIGFTFKENCADTRNSKVVDLVTQLKSYGTQVEIVDTWADVDEVQAEYNLTITGTLPDTGAYDAVVLTVPHQDVVAQGAGRLRALIKPDGVLFDMKSVFAINESDLRL